MCGALRGGEGRGGGRGREGVRGLVRSLECTCACEHFAHGSKSRAKILLHTVKQRKREKSLCTFGSNSLQAMPQGISTACHPSCFLRQPSLLHFCSQISLGRGVLEVPEGRVHLLPGDLPATVTNISMQIDNQMRLHANTRTRSSFQG